MRRLIWPVLITLGLVSGCRHTSPGTHVELVDKDGVPTYVSGAAAPGMNKSQACTAAVGRAVAAIALRFAQENDDLGDDVAEAVGASDGEVFLQRYAKHTAERAAVQDVQFDPADHLCMATVRWKPPVFLKDAILAFAEQMKQAEVAAAEGTPAEATPGAPVAPPSAVAPSAPAVSTPPPAPVSVAPVASVPAAPAATRACPRERDKLARVLSSSQKALDDLEECLRRTKGDETICHRYKLYVDEAHGKEADASGKLAACLNQGLSVVLRRALTEKLPGHAAVSVESRDDGSVVLWAFSPVARTAFALEVGPDGAERSRTALAANQVDWLRGQLGL